LSLFCKVRACLGLSMAQLHAHFNSILILPLDQW